MALGRPTPPVVTDPREAWLIRVVSWLAKYLQDVYNAIHALQSAFPILGSVTLSTGTTTTTITDMRIRSLSRPFFTPTTANAAAEVLALRATCTAGSVTITHNNLATSDRTFHYAIFP